ncbi:MAG: tRNA pseudouridine(38-40) synthase TruA [Acholeplasma sp.]|nr:tRNA pseudouridine(38-40) synthase TruA [Acholeplasma sp.]
MRFKVTIAYDGSNYQGFQAQTNGLGIQAVIEEVSSTIAKEPIVIFASGRTDKGVHALGQVYHFDTTNAMKADDWFRALNTYFPMDISVLKVEEVSLDFHARHSAIKKQYVYIISKDYNLFSRNHELYLKYTLDVFRMQKAISDLVGQHDFKGFGAFVEYKPTIKTMFEASIEETNTHIIFTFLANGFLKYMVRSMVGTLIDIGRGKKEPEVIKQILETQNRQLVGKTANPEGLYLKEVWY